MSETMPRAAQRSPSTSTGRGREAQTSAAPDIAATGAGAAAGEDAGPALEVATGGGTAPGGGAGAACELPGAAAGEGAPPGR
eukprot:6514201-Alexandrium_andersonii.AAC.1